jgi:CHAD domain-containing protein
VARDHLELELKVAVARSFVLPYLGTDGLTHVRADAVRLDARYWDTPDFRLTRRGVSLRHRVGGGGGEWTLKLAGVTRGTELSRREVTLPGENGTVPAELSDAVSTLTGAQALTPVCFLRTERERSYLVDIDGARRVEISDDRVTVLEGEHPVARFREIEAELPEGGDRKHLELVARRLRRAGAHGGEAVVKVVRALGDAARPRVHPPPAPGVAVEQLVAHSVRDGLERLLAHDPAVRLDLGPEAVHQARVATRRLRADLRTMRPVLDEEVVEPIRAQLADIGARLGAVRDFDVLAEELAEAAAELDEPVNIAPLLTRIDTQRADARAALLGCMAEPGYHDVLHTLEVWTAVPPLRDDVDPATPADDVARDLLERSWRRLAKLVAAADGNSPAEQWHEVRKKAKATRYAAELLDPLLRGKAARLAVAAKRIQDDLGRSNDAVHARTWLAEQVIPGEAGAAAACLEVVLAAHGTDVLQQWDARWRAARRAARTF